MKILKSKQAHSIAGSSTFIHTAVLITAGLDHCLLCRHVEVKKVAVISFESLQSTNAAFDPECIRFGLVILESQGLND